MTALSVTAPSVIVTRPAREAAHWVDQLQARGIAATALPLIHIAPCSDAATLARLQQARSQWPQYRALMFVSRNAVEYFFHEKHPLAHDLPGHIAIKTRAWSPGPGTAQALLQAGVAPECIDGPAPDAAQFDSEALWQQVAPQIQPGDRVLVVRGRSRSSTPPDTAPQPSGVPQGTGRDWLARQIEAAGGQVQWVATYERTPPSLTPAQQRQAQQAAHDGSLWLFSSSEALEHLQAALPQQSWHGARALCTHPRIAQTAHAVGFGQVRECRPAMEDVWASIESAA